MTAPLQAHVLETVQVAEGLFHLRLARPAAASHAHPGQYVQVSAGGAPPTPFALASAPGSDTWELLVRAGAGTAGRLAAARAGDALGISSPLGDGFSLADTEGRDLLLLAAGTGISALRSLVLHTCARRASFGRVVLLQGARTPGELAYAQEAAAWRSAGVEVVHTVSRPVAPGWDGAVGRVQGLLPGRVNASTVAFLCGPPGMLQDCATALAGLGVGEPGIRRNF